MNATNENEAGSLVCDLCDATAADITAAIAADWSAAYWDGDNQGNPICGNCAVTRCRVDPEDGELILVSKAERLVKISKAERLQNAISHLESAAEILRQLGGADCDYAAMVTAATISSEGGAAGLRSLLGIWGRK